MKIRALIALVGISLMPFTTLSVFAQRQAASQPVSSALVARAQQITGDRFSVATATPRGVTVVARVMPRAEVLHAIDQGFAQLFAVAQRHGYRNRLNFRDYTVFIGRADRNRDSSGQYSPDIAVGASQYAGSVYDQGGYVFAAGMVLSFGPSAFVIAEHERDFGRISNVVRFEGEHIVLYFNDRRLYSQTMDHSGGGGHPILQ
ncbi:MAG TPA: hypothetical protein VJT71_05045 [Pyrinomonadaceae bacterium]|nr:hypothetical protein [Pyrinomonadaceae bacterium]